MRRSTSLLLAIILGLAAALNTIPLLAMQDQEQVEPCESNVSIGEQTFLLDCTSDFSFGLEVEAVPEAGSVDRLYGVQFVGEPGAETGAYIPERFNREAMVVRVLAGSFAFRVQGPGVIVEPQDSTLVRYMATAPIGLGEDPNVGGRRDYSDGEEISCQFNLQGHVFCLLDPGEFTDGSTFVRLDQGDTVYLPENSTCFMCNTERIDSAPAELLIWTPAVGFNGELEVASISLAAPQQDQLYAARAWAFNPGSRCN